MKRREILAAAAAAPLAAGQTSSPRKPATLEMRWYQLRNGAVDQRQRTVDYLLKVVNPALKRVGAEPAGLFSPMFGAHGPALLHLISYPSIQVFGDAAVKLRDDAEYRRAFNEFYSQPGLPYQRVEIRLLRAFDGFPQIEVPPQEPARPPRIFELRTYESNTPLTLEKKIGMFESGEIAIFRANALAPVFFGRAIAGDLMPNLTYLLAFDSMAAREAGWKAFSADPNWQKLRATPGLSDGEIVSNITSLILSPVSGSPLR